MDAAREDANVWFETHKVDITEEQRIRCTDNSHMDNEDDNDGLYERFSYEDNDNDVSYFYEVCRLGGTFDSNLDLIANMF